MVRIMCRENDADLRAFCRANESCDDGNQPGLVAEVKTGRGFVHVISGAFFESAGSINTGWSLSARKAEVVTSGKLTDVQTLHRAVRGRRLCVAEPSEAARHRRGAVNTTSSASKGMDGACDYGT